MALQSNRRSKLWSTWYNTVGPVGLTVVCGLMGKIGGLTGLIDGVIGLMGGKIYLIYGIISLIGGALS